MTLGEQQTTVRIERMKAALKNAMVTDMNGRIVVCALFEIMTEHPELRDIFVDLCGNFVVKTVMQEHGNMADRERQERIG